MIFMWGNCAYGIILCIIPPRLSDPCTSQVAVAGCPGAAFTVPVPKDPRSCASAKRAMASVSAVSMETPWWFDENLGKIHMKIHWNQIFNDFHPLENLIYLIWFSLPFPTCCHCALLAITVTAAPYVTCQESNLKWLQSQWMSLIW